MNIEEFEKLLKLAKKHIEDSGIFLSSTSEAYLDNIIEMSFEFLPEEKTFLDRIKKDMRPGSLVSSSFAKQIVDSLIEFVEIEKSVQKDVLEAKIFESAEDKLKQAGISFRKEDHPSVINNLNTALELLLKDKLGIPITISKINIVRIIDILVKNKIGPYVYFSEAKKHIVLVDNKVKHQAYIPTKIECINAIKIMEDLISKLRDVDIELDEDVRKKISKEL